MPSLDDENIHDGVDDLPSASLDHWREHYTTKYPRVGILQSDTLEQRHARLNRRRAAAAAADAARSEAARAAAEAAQGRSVSPDELRAHDTSNPELWLCIDGYVLDVTKSRYLYGAGSPRSMFAGKCVGRAVARSTTAPEDLNDERAGLSAKELAKLEERKEYFLNKFPLVGVYAAAAAGSGEL